MFAPANTLGRDLTRNPRALRVCHLGKFYPPAPGGIETHVRTLARAQARLGLDVTVLCINHIDRHGNDATWSRYGATATQYEVDDAGVKIIRVGRSMTCARMDFCPQLPGIVRDLNGDPPDLFHLHTPNVTMLLAVAMLTSDRVPLVITHHSDIIRQRIRRLALSPYESRVYRRAGAIFVSAASYAPASDLLNRHGEKVHLLPMGLDLDPYLAPTNSTRDEERKLREALQSYPAPLWLSVGRCVYYKGQHTAIAALQHVPGTLLIIGQGPLRADLQKLARRLHVSDRVRWCNYATDDQLAAAYRAAHALWFPSNARSESFGLVQVEAMASACPVINTNIPNSGVSWVSRHGETGLTVPVGDANALADAARQLLREPSLRNQLAIAARHRAIEQFDQMKMAHRSVGVYDQVLARRAPSIARPDVQLQAWVRRFGQPALKRAG